MTPAILIPAAARAIREASITGRLHTAAIDDLDAGCKREADVQSLWVAIARRPELASIHAQSIALAIIDEAEEKSAKAKTAKAYKDAMRPVEPWMRDLQRHRGAWLKGGIVVVAWSAGGLGELGWKSMAASKALGVMPALPDVGMVLEGGVTLRIEFKHPGKVSAATGKRIGVGRVKGAQLATLHALDAAGHPSIGASSIRDAAVGLLTVMLGRIR